MNKPVIVQLLLAASLGATAITPDETWFEDQTVLGVNKENAHATYTPYATIADLQADTEFFATPWVESKSSLFQSLNGQWKFFYSPTPDEAPDNFYESSYDSSSWDIIPVPSCWQMLGYDTPIYINADFPFNSSKYPKIVARSDNDGYDVNPVGSYLTEFNVPQSWGDKQLFLNFEGIYSAAYVWVNGEFVGYSQAANTYHEFDITAYAKTGANTLAVKVIKWSDGSYLEDQDMMRWGGIFRDVTLTAVPKTFIRDHRITSELNSGYTSGTINIDLELDNRDSAKFTGTAEVKILDTDLKTVVATLPSVSVNIAAGATSTLSTSASLSSLKPWTAETPNLYTVVFSLKDNSGNELEAFATKYGFRKIEQRNRFIYINGQKVFFKGVNRQDTHPVTGRMQTVETLLQDVLLFKQFNINTVRTSHCPHQAKMMAMYDHFGIYVMDEADLETHAMNWALVDDPEWSPAYVDRQQRMVLRDRNHPSVIFWSMGNESRNGENFANCRAAIQELDDRLIHYEGQQVFTSSDFTSKMYPYEADVISADNSNDSRPHFFCEYAHSMGQSLGNLVDYWDYIENSNRIIGGCIWDWADQAIYDPQQIKNGTYKQGDYRTGYDYPGPHQGNFVCNGVVGPEREVNAKLVEVKKVYQWIKMDSFSSKFGRINVSNTYDFIDLSSFKVLWSVSRNGIDVENGEITDFNVGAEKTDRLTIPYTTEITDDAEYLLTVRFVTLEATDWADAGHVVAEEQFAMNDRPDLPEKDLSTMEANVETKGNGPVEISGDGFTYSFDSSGNLVSMNFGGHEYIYNGQGLKLDTYRWIENDSPYSGEPPSQSEMTSVVATGTHLYCSFTEGDARGAKAVTLSASFESSGNVSYTNYYTIYADGTLDLKTTYINHTSTSALSGIPRVGQSMSLDPALENLEYFARGPWSNYCDRKTASFAAVYKSTVTDERESFIRPQSMGNHEELRYLKLTSKADPDYGLLIETEGQVSFSALHYIESDYGAVTHDQELEARDEVILHLDYQQKGIGNGSCGSTIWSRYMIPSGSLLTNKLRFTPLLSKSAGYAVPEGSAGAYLTDLTIGDTEIMKGASAPDDLYQLLPVTVKLAAGSSEEIVAKTSKTANIAAWIDLNHDQEFSDDEKMNGLALTTPAETASGEYRLRIVVDESNPTADGTVTSGSVYDLTVRLTLSRDENVTYITPNGSMHKDKLAYVKSIVSKGAAENIEYEAATCPTSVYSIIPDVIKAGVGSSFSITFTANEAGPRSTTEVYQDLRYNYAGVFADFAGTGTFEQVGFFGSKINANASSATNVLANYDDVMTFTQKFEIPEDVTVGTGRIRVIYENAWTQLTNFYADMQSIKDGIAYDIEVEIVDADEIELDYTTLTEMTFDSTNGSMHADGKAWVERIASDGATVDIDVTLEAPETFLTTLSEAIISEPGSEFNILLDANKAGPRSSQRVYQDLRYNYAHFFLGLPGEVEMYSLGSVGDRLYGSDILGNYDEVMNIEFPVQIPLTADEGRAILRVIYQNAWHDAPDYNSNNVSEGVAYDIPVRLGDVDSIKEVNEPASAISNVVYDLLGRRVNKDNLKSGIYIVNNKKVYIK